MAASISAVSKDGVHMRVDWSDSTTDRYPFVWLRDNCHCPACYVSTAMGRLVLMSDLDANIVSDNVANSEDGEKVTVQWPDSHTSEYASEFLRHHRLGREQVRQKYDLQLKFTRTPWDASFNDKFPQMSFDEIMDTDAGMYEFLVKLYEFGFFLIRKAPTEKGVLTKFSRKIAFQRVTNYGFNFQVQSKSEPSNAAYTSKKLGLHTDLPYYNYQPGIQMLHCISPSLFGGGENQFADGFETIKRMKELRPDLYKIATEEEFDFFNYGSDFVDKYDYRNRSPLCTLNRDGTPKMIYYNNQIRQSYLTGSPDLVYQKYQTLKMFDTLSTEQQIQLKMQAGDIAVFDNSRVLHARSEYVVPANGVDSRLLEGIYVDWDDALSRLRVVAKKLGKL